MFSKGLLPFFVSRFLYVNLLLILDYLYSVTLKYITKRQNDSSLSLRPVIYLLTAIG
jgi:hypothetical protein